MADVPKASFKEITKHPMTYALMVCVSLLVFFAGRYSSSNAANRDDCWKVNAQLTEDKNKLTVELSEARKEMNSLYNQLLVKNNIINEAVGTGVDSFVRKKLQPKVIENLLKK